MIACEGRGGAPPGAKKVILGIGAAVPVAAVGNFGNGIAAHCKAVQSLLCDVKCSD
jgi:hypothetical protein